jgi:hypothetical protein
VQTEEFKTVYDILQEGRFSLNYFLIFWMFGVFIIGIASFRELWRRGFRVNSSQDWLGLFIVPIFVIVGIFGNFNSYSVQSNCLQNAQTGNFKVTEGLIKNLETTSKRESFTVNNTRFEYSENDVSKCGYTQRKGFPLTNDLRVKISYEKDQILKLEIQK